MVCKIENIVDRKKRWIKLINENEDIIVVTNCPYSKLIDNKFKMNKIFFEFD